MEQESSDSIQEILELHDIDFLESGHHHCRPGWIQFRECPLCHSANYHLGFNVRARFFACYSCGGHSVVSVLNALGLPGEVGRFLGGDFKQSAQRRAEIQPRLGLKEPLGRGPLKKPHRAYLRGRGFNPKEIERIWKVEGITLHPTLGWRIYIPIIYRDKRVSWTTRAIGSRVTQRYLSAGPAQESINHKHLIYGRDYVQHSIVIVEGPTDAWAIGPGAGATFGTSFLTKQIELLSHIPYRFVCFDSAPRAQRKANELCEMLAIFPGVTTNILIDAKDPGSASPREITRIRRVARL